MCIYGYNNLKNLPQVIALKRFLEKTSQINVLCLSKVAQKLIATNQYQYRVFMLGTFFSRSFLRPSPFSLLTRFAFSQQSAGESGKQIEITKENAQLIIDKWVKQNKVVLFMKGTPHSPQCGYSNFVVELLKKYGLTEYKAINVLDDAIVREEAKRYKNWPTFPQLYIDGDLIGGSNILQEMHKDKSLQSLLEQKNLI